jgi:hypothetical protein
MRGIPVCYGCISVACIEQQDDLLLGTSEFMAGRKVSDDSI